jgi:hypothetical protein
MKVNFHPKGPTPKDITNILKNHGWKPVYGSFDFAYHWEDKWGANDTNIQTFLEFINKTHEALKGSEAFYSFSTYEHGKENFYVKWCE